jgi:hypothetical protein
MSSRFGRYRRLRDLLRHQRRRGQETKLAGRKRLRV